MTPHQFISKWRGNALKERSASQSHFNDLCALLGVADPVTADPKGEWFAFEKGANKAGGDNGWADVWRKDCFAWEYKGPRKDLDAAFRQLLQYSYNLENPPLLIVSDMDRIRVHTNWTSAVQEVHAFTLDDLIDANVRDRLKAAFTDPESWKPAKTRTALTEETAREFASLAQRLRDRGHDADKVAHFIQRLVFCMFAEDAALLPDNIFSKMLTASRSRPDNFERYAKKLFGAMAHKDGEIDFTPIDWFNGGLFEDDHVIPLTSEDIDALWDAAKRDWSQIDPAIMGTLFERGLDPGKRSQLGAHYTDRTKIMMIIEPVIIRPLEDEWARTLAQMTALIENAREAVEASIANASQHADLAEEVQALQNVLTNKAQLELFEDLQTQRRVKGLDKLRAAMRTTSRGFVEARVEARRIHRAFIDRLERFRVLDPACGSGNFLYLALKALKDIEHRANLDAEPLGIERGFPRTGPDNVLGIEINPYAAELARVSVWIGDIQWMRKNGFDPSRNPILRSLDTIECRDAVLNADGTRADWPVADVVVGNPPFLGGKRLLGELGEEYVFALRKAYADSLTNFSDLVCYWFAKSWEQIAAGGLLRAGLVSTNSIRGGANREALRPIVANGSIFEAWSDEAWTVDGAAVRVSLVNFAESWVGQVQLNGQTVEKIHSDLTANNVDLTAASKMLVNNDVAFIGVQKTGPFDIDGNLARIWLLSPKNPTGESNSVVLKPYVNGAEIVRRPQDTWIIDFGATRLEQSAALFELPFEYARDKIRSVRLMNAERIARDFWWRHWRPRPELASAAKNLNRVIITPRVAKHRLFAWRHSSVLPDSAVVAIAREDDTSFGILHSRFHELWSLRMGTFLGVGNDPRYTPSTTFETFPFPEGLTPNIPAADYATDQRAMAIATAAARLNELRENWLNPADLVVREPEVVPGYPDRILPKDETAAVELKKRTLTNLYNVRPAWLDNAHRDLNEAVADAYGWGNDWRAGLLNDNEILARLFALNQERAAAQ